jgi:tetratricopeptide (TPR) repeat protein
MKSESVAYAVAGIAFGLLAGWVIGWQQAALRPVPPAPAAAAAAPAAQGSTRAAPILDEAKVKAFTSVAEREPKNATARVELGNLYFDSERYDDAIKWYSEALKLQPNDANVSTDLGVAYYYVNQPDKALAQFDHSLKIDPKHSKTILNVGIVRAFGKQDLAGAEKAWEEVLKLSPDSPEGQAAKRALDSLRSAHPPGAGEKPGA